jgi:hypothetical protein
MSNIIKEIEQSLSEVPPLKIDIKPVMQTAPAPDPLEGVKPVALPEAVPQSLPAPQPSAPIQTIPSTGSPVPEVPQVDALSYGDTVSRMSAQSAAEIQKTIAASGTPKPNDVQNSLLNPNTPVQIDPKLSSQANPFAGNKAENAQERLAFEPPVLANGLANPFSDPNARAAIAAGISKEEYIAYIRDVKAKGEETTFGVPLQPNNLPLEVLQQQQLAASWQGLTAEQMRKKMAEKSGYLSARRNFNTSFLPFAGSENRNELETLFAALSFPANLVKGIGLDVLRPAAAVVAGGANIEEIKRAYEAMRPTKGGTFTGAAVLGQDFSSLAIVDQKGAAFNPLAAVRDDKNLFQIALGFGLDILADPLNNDKVAELLFKPVGLFQRAKLPDVPTPPSATALSREIVPVVTEKYRQTPTRLVTSIAGDTPPVRPQPDRVPTPNIPPRLDTPVSATESPRQLEAPREVIIEREVARTNELAVYKPTEVVFPEPRQPYTPIPDSRAIVPVSEVNLYNNVTALFNESDDLEVVQRFMRDVVEQKPYEQIPDARSLVVVQNPILREVAEFAQTGDLTPNIAALQGATVDEIADIVADRLELADDTPLVVPRLQIQPIEIPQLDYSITSQLPKQSIVRAETPLYPSMRVSLDSISTPVPKSFDPELVDSLARQMVDASDSVRPIIVERVSPVEFKVLGGDLQYAAAARAVEINPDFELRSVIVEKGTPTYDAVLRQERAYGEVSKLSEDATLARTAKDTPTYLGSKSEQELRTAVGTRTLDIDTVTTQRGGAYSEQAVNRMAESLLETGGNIRPIVVRRTSPVDFEVIRGNLEYLAAKRAAEIDPQFTGVRAYIVDPKNEAAILRQLDILDEGIPVTTTKPVVVTEAPFTSLSDLIDDARDGSIQSLSEVKNWSQKGDFVTKLKDIPNAVDDLGIDALNTPSLVKVVKGRVGKLSDKVVKEVSASLVKVDIKKAEDISKSLFDALWRKSTDEQKQTILSTIPTNRLNELGLERVETKITPPELPTLQHEQAVMYHGAGSVMSRLDDSFYSTENIYGNGLYTTADMSVANSYRKKNTTSYNREGYLYSLTEKSPVKLLDLDKPLNLQSVEGKAVIEHLKRLQRSGNDDIETLADGALDELSQGLSVGKMMDNTRRFNEGGSETLTDFIDSFREPLSKSGYGGYTHEGGVLTGSKRHQVNIYWKTEDVLELKQLEPAPDFSGSYHVVNDSRAELYELRKEMLLAQGYDKREAVMTAKRGHPISEEIENTGAVSDKSLELLVRNRELYSDYPSEQKWSSKMLQQIWEVARPEQKSYLMTNLDNIEKLGLERIARSNVIDDHLPIEKEFDTPC